MTSTFQAILIDLLEQMRVLEERIARTNQWITAFMKNSALCQKIQVIDGVGPIAATAMVAAVGDAKEFKNGIHLSAWLGLVQRQYSSCGKSRLQGLSKRGDTYLRTLLIHGARVVLGYAIGKADASSQ